MICLAINGAVILLLLAVLVLLICYKLLTHDYDLMQKFDGPKLYPIVGNLSLLLNVDQSGVFTLMRRCSEKYGTFRLWSLGIGQIHNSRVKEAEILLKSSRHADKSVMYTFLHNFLGTGLLTSNGKKWQHRRKILTPAFHFNILRQFASIFHDESEKVIAHINSRIAAGDNVLDVSTISCRFTLNTICETAMGVKLDSMDNADEYRNNVYKVGKLLIYRVMRPWLYVPAIYKILGYQRQSDKYIKEIHDFTRSVISRRRKMFYESQEAFEDLQNENIYETKKCRYAMLDTLLSAEANGLIDEAGIREEVDTFMFEGHDTTSSGITFSLLLLATHPHIQQRLYEEIKEAVDRNNGENLTMNQFNDLLYLDRVLKECLRIYSPVTFISRTTTEEIELRGVHVKAGMTLHLHIIDVHRDEEVYPDPDKFDPDRFLPENVAARNPFAYIPFSAGLRNCIGQKFAVLEMKTIIQQILMNFKLTPITKREDVIFVADLVLRTHHPILIQFDRR